MGFFLLLLLLLLLLSLWFCWFWFGFGFVVWLWVCGFGLFFFLSGGKEGRVRDQGGFRMQASKLASKKEGLEGLKCSCPSQAWEMSEDEFLWKRQGKKDAIA